MNVESKTTAPVGRGRLIRLLLGVLMVLAVVSLPYFNSPYAVYQLSQVLIYFLAILSLSFLTGYSGQVSLGHSVFFAVGAYTAAITGDRMPLPLIATFALSFTLAFVLGAAVAIPALYMSGHYRVAVTLGLAIVTPGLLTRFDDLTGGSQGMFVDPPSAPSWTGLASDQFLFFIALAPLAVGLIFVRNLTRGRMKRGSLAVKGNEIVARSLGVNSARTKVLSFGISAGLAGMAGVTYAFLVGYVTPHAVAVLLSINLLVAACIAGLRSIYGAVFGAVLLVYVPVYAADVNSSLSAVIFGVIVIAVSLFMPNGVAGALSSWAGKAWRRLEAAPWISDTSAHHAAPNDRV